MCGWEGAIDGAHTSSDIVLKNDLNNKHDIPSRKHLRTKVTPDFHLTYSKNGEICGSESK